MTHPGGRERTAADDAAILRGEIQGGNGALLN